MANGVGEATEVVAAPREVVKAEVGIHRKRKVRNTSHKEVGSEVHV